MRRLTIAAIALIVALTGLYFMVQMYFGGVGQLVFKPPDPIFMPAQTVIMPRFPTPLPTSTAKIHLYGLKRPAPLVKATVEIIPAPPLPDSAYGAYVAPATPTPTPMPAPTFASVTPPPLPGVQLPIGMRTPAPTPTVNDVDSSGASPAASSSPHA